jgi:hypothetical protein
MHWQQTQTDRDWDAAHRISEQLRHERLAREASIICPIETTPATESIPQLTMARHRQSLLDQQTQQLRDIWTDDKDEPMPL